MHAVSALQYRQVVLGKQLLSFLSAVKSELAEMHFHV